MTAPQAPRGPAVGATARPGATDRLLSNRQASLALLTLGLALTMTVASPAFSTIANLRVVALGIAIDAVMVVGMTLVIIGGGFDLSVGAILALAAVTTGLGAEAGLPWLVAALGGLVMGALAGLVNGLLIGRIGVNALIATLGTLYVFRGTALVLTEGRTVSAGDSPLVKVLGQGDVAGIPVPVLVAATVVVVGTLGVHRLRASRELFYVGSNRTAARLAGIDVTRTTVLSYTVMGLLAGVAGLLAIGRVGNASPTVGVGRELAVITAVILGGASLRGGEGSIGGSILALILLALVNNALILLAVPVFYQQLSVGLVLILAVVLNLWRLKVRDRRAIQAALQAPPKQPIEEDLGT